MCDSREVNDQSEIQEFHGQSSRIRTLLVCNLGEDWTVLHILGSCFQLCFRWLTRGSAEIATLPQILVANSRTESLSKGTPRSTRTCGVLRTRRLRILISKSYLSEPPVYSDGMLSGCTKRERYTTVSSEEAWCKLMFWFWGTADFYDSIGATTDLAATKWAIACWMCGPNLSRWSNELPPRQLKITHRCAVVFFWWTWRLHI